VLSHIDSIRWRITGHPRQRSPIEADTVSGIVAIEQLKNITGGENIDQILVNIRVATENVRELTDSLKTNPSVLIRGNNVKDRKPGEVMK
jgi:hypothetical protein